MVERGFELSETSNTPVDDGAARARLPRPGSFTASQQNRAPAISNAQSHGEGRPISCTSGWRTRPAIFPQEKKKSDVRLPAARKFIASAG